MHSDVAAIVRRFNRSYTQRIGALDDSFLGMGLPLGTARLLFEIGAEPGSVQELRARLGLDSGYLSRLLRRLEQEALVTLSPDPQDRRRRRVELTAAGRAAWDDLERRSEERAHLLVDPLTPRQQQRLADALATADLLVRAATVSLEPVDPMSPPAQQAMGAYFAELDARFPHGFDAGSQSTKDAELLSPPNGIFVVAVSDGTPVACGGVQTQHQMMGPGTDAVAYGEIKRMWVHDGWRGAGLGSRLLRHLEAAASELGHDIVRLDTNDALVEAIAMYQRAGYAEIERYNDNPYARHFFEKRL
ncbi:bifunctional helix-turn-helix transcriptional regulator/GNAT family N-acetyltransferase [Nocardioides nematodiphilus]|uniref:bifunctional helix-turn-helix transcriptional regulator/GNAT family N-acetyltransferase n=1 Tax=Nocardioides nematodiphilus TaxID=2849669 RepID=UPI001CDA2F8C|nr:bifunctional helix-turn-helix transcriptional regulator/GNAT family N-acetyltransferase [Nocardioides nematodiphilus]MCA1983589.1 bifunctional helix-turn-helix transcriptional regulator/GNAT family N-acetyltransferase [Nocardioides nematodiphilus]